MSVRLYGDEVITSLALAQPMVCGKNESLHGVRLHLLRVGAPTGNLFVSVYNDSGTLMSTSPNKSIATLGTAGTDWFGMVPFNLDIICVAGQRYWFKLGFSSYTFSETNHVAWLREYGFGRNKYTTRTLFGPSDAPLDIEMWENKLITKGTYP